MSTPQELRTEAESLFCDGDLDGALARYLEIAQRIDAAPRTLSDAGMVCIALGRIAEIAQQRGAVPPAPQPARQEVRKDEAPHVSACRQAMRRAEADPPNAGAWRDLARAANDCAEFAEAEPRVRPGDAIRILPVSLLDEERALVEEMRSIGQALSKGLGWHYLLDLPWAARMLGARRGMRVLDAGAGVGLMQWWLAAQGVDVLSVDRGRRWHPRFHAWCPIAGLRPCDVPPGPDGQPPPPPGRGVVTLYNQNLADMPDVPDGSVDAVVSISALEHNEPEALRAVVRELMRVLKPGGRLVATLGAAGLRDWFHEPSGGWCYTEATLRDIFDLDPGCPSNFERYDELLENLKSCAELRDGLDPYYFRSGDNGMPWGKWDPKYCTVGVVKVKTG